MTDLRPFGIDVSRHQGVIDWEVVKAHKPEVEFCGIRAGISWRYVDPFFGSNWAEAKKVNIPRAAYHVLYPDQDWKRQMDHFLKLVGDDKPEMGYVIDLELVRDIGPYDIRAIVGACQEYLQWMTGMDTIIYSRAQWIDDYMTWSATPPVWYHDVWWWLAHYLPVGMRGEHKGPPDLPRGVNAEDVIIHQTSDKQPNIGGQAKTTDTNRWVSYMKINEFMEDGMIAEPEPTPEPDDCCEKLDAIKAMLEE